VPEDTVVCQGCRSIFSGEAHRHAIWLR